MGAFRRLPDWGQRAGVPFALACILLGAEIYLSTYSPWLAKIALLPFAGLFSWAWYWQAARLAAKTKAQEHCGSRLWDLRDVSIVHAGRERMKLRNELSIPALFRTRGGRPEVLALVSPVEQVIHVVDHRDPSRGVSP